MLSSPDVGHDVQSVQLLLSKHKTVEDQMDSLERQMNGLVGQGHQLVAEGIAGSEQIEPRIQNVQEMWAALKRLVDQRRQRLVGAVDYYQFFSETGDMDAWLLDTLRQVSSEDVGKDEGTVQTLIKKHDEVTDDLHAYQQQVAQLESQVQQLPEDARDHPDVRNKLSTIGRRYGDLQDLAKLRKQRLLDALALYKLFNDAESVEAWIDEKAKLLKSLKPGGDLEEVEIMRHRFITLEHEMRAQAKKVDTVNELARQLLHVEHPNSDEILQRQNKLNAR